MNNDYELLKREVEALDTAAIYLRTANNQHLFSRSTLDFLQEISDRAERIKNIADEEIRQRQENNKLDQFL
jgi:hypothetical protein